MTPRASCGLSIALDYRIVETGALSKFIVIEGLIGVGKTSLCKLLQRELDARLILEPADDNPFLTSFYADPDRFAFPAQMFYLASRYAQQMDLSQDSLFTELVVSDYLYAKDRIFAEQTLEGHEMELYNRFTHLLDGGIAPPEFVVFLEAPIDAINERISRRAISAEKRIQPSYLEQLRKRYYELWDNFGECPVYPVDTSEINYVDRPEDARRIVELIQGWLAGEPVSWAPPAYQSAASQLTLFERGYQPPPSNRPRMWT